MAAERPARRSSSLNEAAEAASKTVSPKYVPLRGDQQIELDVLAKELQAARTRKSERITANTVIRVAVDVLLKRRGVLVGDTEEELLASFMEYIEGLESQRAAGNEVDPDEGS
ncbi:chromosome segregation ATPase [Streptomyces sp. NPDC006134]|uniref:chromosome segregation ATPase n=1 Tax=Streptomyces sp. NPDC006134 TaxID=3154467 RepID=UPI0033D29379